jgi:hypothetical protein
MTEKPDRNGKALSRSMISPQACMWCDVLHSSPSKTGQQLRPDQALTITSRNPNPAPRCRVNCIPPMDIASSQLSQY